MSLDSALALIESVKDYSVLFVGDNIVDEYHYCTPMGKSPKENIIPALYHDKEVFEGGTLAAAKHLETFCRRVEVRASPTSVRKVRFVDNVYLRKVFEVHYEGLLARNIHLDGEFDVVVVTDFGHDRVSAEMIERLVQMPFLAVNAQTNSSNIGFNLITKYPRADYIVIDEYEARLAAQSRSAPIEDVIKHLSEGRCDKFVVTLGIGGAIGYQDGQFYRAPARTQTVIDSMGAGDAFFAVTAPLAKTGCMEDLLLIGNAAGAMKTMIVGHRASITKGALIGYLRSNPLS